MLNDPQAYKVLCAKYYEYSIRYCLNKQDRDELAQAFKNECEGMDIVKLVEEISPLGFRFKFTDEMPSEEKRKKVTKAVNEDYKQYQQEYNQE